MRIDVMHDDGQQSAGPGRDDDVVLPDHDMDIRGKEGMQQRSQNNATPGKSVFVSVQLRS